MTGCAALIARVPVSGSPVPWRDARHEPPPGVRTDLAVTAELASQLGHGMGSAAGPRVRYEEPRRASVSGTADYAGVTWERVDAKDGVFWPCPSVDWPDTPRLFVRPLARLTRA